MIVYIIGILNFVLSFKNIIDPDYGWHISVGRYILENKMVPKSDIFSWYGKINNLEFISHEWLSDVFMYLLGDFGIIMLLSISCVIFYIFIVKFLKFSKHFNVSSIIKVIWLLLSFITIGTLQHRPYLFSYLLFVIFIYILFKYLNNNTFKKLIYIVPLLQLFWVNLHGGSSSLILLILFIVIFLSLIFKDIRDVGKVKVLSLIFIISCLVSLLNPYGYKILFYPFYNMKDTIMLNTIVEWFSPNFHGLYGIYIFAIVVIPILLFIFYKKDKNIIDIVLYFMFLFMMLRSIRFMHYYIFIATYIVGKYMIDFNDINIKFKINMKVIKIFTCIILSILTVMGVLYQVNNFNKENKHLYYYSDTAILKLIELKPKRLFNDYTTGGYLTYKLYGTNIDIFINGIADIYSSNILSDSCNLVNLSDDPDKILEKYNFDVIIIMRNVPLEWYLIKDDNYDIYYQDDTATIFKRI